MFRLRFTLVFTLFVGFLMGTFYSAFCSDALAQSTWKPSKTVQLAIHGGPGSGSDHVWRSVFKMVEDEGLLPKQAVQVIYKEGGSSAVSQMFMASQKGNDHLLAAWTSTWIGAAVSNPDLKVNILHLTPVLRLVNEPAILIVNASSPFKTLKDLTEYGKKYPNKLKQVGGSVTSVDNMYRFIIMKATGAKWDYIPTKGPQRIPAVLGGNADMYVAQALEVREFIRAGKIRVLCTLTDERQEELPDVPTVKEAGLDIKLLVTARGFTAPPDTPAPVVDYWVDLFKKFTKTKRWKDYVQKNGLTDSFMYGDNLTKFIKEQFEMTREIMIDSGMMKK